MKTVSLLVALAFVANAENRFHFLLSRPAEVVAEISLSSPGSDWSAAGREGAVANVTLDGSHTQNVMVSTGPAPRTYRIFLGEVGPGEHDILVERNAEHSAKGSDLNIQDAKLVPYTTEDPYYGVLASAPVLYARQNTIDKFSDVPLLAYCERLVENAKPLLQYTVIFSNEDGGTSTRALMARWGRTTDIEYLYRGFLGSDGKVKTARIQGRNHVESDFQGAHDGSHPILIPVTDNNMVGTDGTSALRFQPAPVVVDLTTRSRESVMDEHAPYFYDVMVKELEREQKLRPYGIVDGEKISSPRNYLYVDYRASNHNAALAAKVRLKSGEKIQSSDLGRIDYAIARDGVVRTTVELPPGTTADQITEIGFECIVAAPPTGKPIAHSGTCEILQVNKAFLMDQDSIWNLSSPVTLATGEMRLWRR
jgi:hypothetical protein